MSSTNYTRWWRDGSIAATKNSNEVVGTSTYWATTNINPGDIMKINGVDYEVQKVTDDTHITLATPYTGETGSGLAYAIVRNFTSTTNAKVAAQTSELMYDFAHFIDKEHATITGKSAYEIAKDNGYVGTEAQWLESLSAYGQAKKNGYTGTMAEWLESLKAAGEWSNANTRITALETGLNPLAYQSWFSIRAAHNSIIRGKNLGTSINYNGISAIIDGGNENTPYLGDYWELTIGGEVMKAVVVQVGGSWKGSKISGYPQYGGATGTGLHMMLVTGRHSVMNDEKKTGGYWQSKMHKEVLPALLVELKEAIGEEHIDTFKVEEKSGCQLELFSYWDIFGKLAPTLDNVVQIHNPLAFFKHMYHSWMAGAPYNLHTWLRNTPIKEGFETEFWYWTGDELWIPASNNTEDTNDRYCPHFILIP